ncbi:MAG: alpha/beta hydrolase [Chloroflexota bacterium]|nr:alpha/beta hydrolase [Chloroflexota bacterium]
MASHIEDIFSTSEGLEFFQQRWLPSAKPRANLVVAHGLGEHSGRYRDFAAWFVSRGYAVHSYDHRGHGKSPGQRGHIDSWAEYREDLQDFVTLVRREFFQIPTFLVGHSMGGLMVLDYALHYPEGLQGVVSSGPALDYGEDVSRFLLFAARVLSRVTPRMKMASGLDADGLSRNQEVVKAYREDPLVHGWVSPRFVTVMGETMAVTLQNAGQWPADLPLFIIHGGADPICPPSGSLRFFEQVDAQDKSRRAYPGFLHESFNEIGREEVLGDVTAWLEARLG